MKKTTYVVRKRHLKREKKRRMVRMTTFLVLLLSIVIGALATFPSAASDDNGRMKYYASVTIEEGDSLWSIAEEYCTDEYTDVNAYIKELCRLNHMDMNASIHAGAHLVVPYYDAMH